MNHQDADKTIDPFTQEDSVSMAFRTNGFISRLSRATSAILDGVAQAIDHIVHPQGDQLPSSAPLRGIPIDQVTAKDIERMILTGAMRDGGMLPSNASVLPKKDPNSVVKDYPIFPEREFKFPSHIVHMDLEVTEIENEEMFDSPRKTVDRTYINKETGKKIVKYSEDPMIAIKGVRRLDEQETMVMLTMRDSFSFLSELLFEIPNSWTKEESEEVLTAIISRIMKKSGWTYEEALISLLIRDFLEPLILQVNKQQPEALDETVRLFVSKEGVPRWAMVPYHSPSLELGSCITPNDDDFPQMPGGEDDYVEGDEGF
jgi:hypothetical protein